MKSNICKIEKGTRALDAILKESERVAEYNGLNHKQTLQLRLICEEIDGMLPNIISDFEGDFWIDFADGVCKVNASINIPEFNYDEKEDLLNIAKNKKNAAAIGIVGKIRDFIEDCLLDDEAMNAASASSMFYVATGYSEGVNYPYLWTLEQYRTIVKEEEKTEAWDELEKSVIASVADDVIVGIKGKRADIVIVKKFA